MSVPSSQAKTLKKRASNALASSDVLSALSALNDLISLPGYLATANDHYRRCYCHSQMKQYSEAFRDANAVIELDPEWYKGHYLRGVVLAGMENTREAASSLRRALALTRNGVERRKVQAKLERIAPEEKEVDASVYKLIRSSSGGSQENANVSVAAVQTQKLRRHLSRTSVSQHTPPRSAKRSLLPGMPWLSEEGILDFVGESAYQKGAEVLRQRLIQHASMQVDPARLGATIYRSSDRVLMYHVQIEFADTKVASFKCDCPSAKEAVEEAESKAGIKSERFAVEEEPLKKRKHQDCASSSSRRCERIIQPCVHVASALLCKYFRLSSVCFLSLFSSRLLFYPPFLFFLALFFSFYYWWFSLCPPSFCPTYIFLFALMSLHQPTHLLSSTQSHTSVWMHRQISAGLKNDGGVIRRKDKKMMFEYRERDPDTVDIQYRLIERLSRETAADLRARLEKNGESRSGTKQELLSRLSDRMVHGSLPMCPGCGRGRLQFVQGFYVCRGSFNDRQKKVLRCGFQEPASTITRPQWVGDLDILSYARRVPIPAPRYEPKPSKAEASPEYASAESSWAAELDQYA